MFVVSSLVMILTLLLLTAAHAELLDLVMQSRMRRGYAFEDKVTRQRKVERVVVSIPHISKEVSEAASATMIGAYDVAIVMRRLRMLFGELWAIQLQGASASAHLLRRVTCIVSSACKEVSRIFNAMKASHEKLPNWDAKMNEKVESMMSEISVSLYEICSSIESLAKHVTLFKVEKARAAFRNRVTETLIELLTINIQTAITSSYDAIRDPAEKYAAASKILEAACFSHRHYFLMWRTKQRLFFQSLMDMRASTCRGDHLKRSFMSEGSASAIEGHLKHHCIPSLSIVIGEHPFPGDRETFRELAQKNKEYSEASSAILAALGNPILCNRGATVASRETQISLLNEILTLSIKHEGASLALYRARREYALNGLAYYKDKH